MNVEEWLAQLLSDWRLLLGHGERGESSSLLSRFLTYYLPRDSLLHISVKLNFHMFFFLLLTVKDGTENKK